MQPAQLVACGPVGDRAPSAQEARLTQKERPRADRGDAARARGQAGQVRGDRKRLAQRGHERAADQDRVDAPLHPPQRPAGHQLHAAGGDDRAGRGRGDLDAIAVLPDQAIGGGEHTGRTGHVEQLDPREGDHQDQARCHRPQRTRRPVSRQWPKSS
jgi:hypothetical protein